MWTTIFGSKLVLGKAAIIRRPGGGGRGFPSGHTASAVFGASVLAHACRPNASLIRTAVVVAGAYVGGSRIDGDSHDVWKVLAGALLALGLERGLRRRSPWSVAGLQCALTDRWALFGEAKLARAQVDADLHTGGSLETDITTGALNLGLGSRF